MKLGEFERAEIIQERVHKIKGELNKINIAKKALAKKKDTPPSISSIKGGIEVFFKKTTQTIEMSKVDIKSYVEWKEKSLKKEKARLEKEFRML